MARLFTSGAETGDNEWNGTYTRVTASASYKRTGTYSWQFSTGGTPSPATARVVFDANKTEIYGRFALYMTSAIAGIAVADGMQVVDFRDVNNNNQFVLVYNAGTSSLSLYDDADNLLSIGNVVIPSDTWVVVEFRAVIGASGPFVTKINGTTDISYTGNTDLTGEGNLRSLAWRGQLFNPDGLNSDTWFHYVDDIAINDTAGSYQNSWAGLGGVFYLEPTADGDQNDWTPSSGTVNYAMVDDIPPDGATTFNQGSGSGAIELYEVDDCPQYINAVNLVEVVYRAALVTSGYNELTDIVKVNGTVYSGTPHTIVPITPSFTFYKGSVSYLNPNTGTAWGTAEINAMQAGVNITV